MERYESTIYVQLPQKKVAHPVLPHVLLHGFDQAFLPSGESRTLNRNDEVYPEKKHKS